MEEIKEIDSYRTATDNYKKFGYYANATRALASDVDGFKVVYRRMLWTALHHPKGKFVKSAVISGETMKLHPHGEQSGVLYSLVNSKLKMFDKQGNFGSALIPGSAPRYTECRVNKMADLYLGQDLINYCEMVEGDIGYMEPKYLPTLIPFILVDGNSSMGIGISPVLPSLDILDLAKFYRAGLTGEDQVVKLDIGNSIVHSSEEVVSNSIKAGSIKGFRYGINPSVEGNCIIIDNLPPGLGVSRVEKVFREAIEKDLVDFRDESNSNMRYVYEVIKGDISSYIRKLGDLTSTVSYELVMTGSYSESGNVVYTSLNDMRTKTLNYLRDCSIRKFDAEIKRNSEKLEIMKVIKYLKDNNLVKDLPNMTTEQVVGLLPFSKDSIESALRQSISKLTKSIDETELVDLEKLIDELKLNKSNPDGYIVKLYDDFIDQLSSSYVNRTTYMTSDIKKSSTSISILKDSTVIVGLVPQSRQSEIVYTDDTLSQSGHYFLVNKDNTHGLAIPCSKILQFSGRKIVDDNAELGMVDKVEGNKLEFEVRPLEIKWFLPRGKYKLRIFGDDIKSYKGGR